MLANLLAGMFEPRSRRQYVGKHRASQHMRYIATVKVQPAEATRRPEHTDA